LIPSWQAVHILTTVFEPYGLMVCLVLFGTALVKTGVWLRAKEMKVSATQWASRLGKDFPFFTS